MAGFFYDLGKMLGPKVRKARWMVNALTGSEADLIRAELDVGRDLARAFAEQMEIERRADVAAWLTEVGSRLAAGVAPPQWRFQFYLVKSAECNAFALPGGFVFVTTQLCELCRWQVDETAFILGHEMGHIVKHHAMDRMMANSLLSVALTRLPVGRGVLKPSLVGLAGTLLQQGYSREQELDADQFGALLARRGGFEADAALRLLARLQSELGEPSGYFASHPPFEARIRHLQRILGS